MVSRANNHTTDWGVEGMLETNRILDKAGFVHAGSGQNLGEARAPAFFQTATGRIAMISAASSHSTLSRAAHTRPDIRGRPGLSFLRTTRTVTLDAATYAALKKATIAMQASRTPPGEEEMTFFGTRVRKGDANRAELRADERDVAEILQQVRSARHQADFVFVTIHAHEPGNWSETPPDFLEQFARATIDAGADMFLGHGPHQVRAIEIYKGRPIFYSLGNFLFQFETFGPQAADVYETYNLDPFRTTIGEFFDSLKGKGLEFKEDIWWESVIAKSTWEKGALKAIELHPIDLGYGLPRAQKGTPRTASPALAKKVIERLARLSKAYGTVIRLENNIGIIDITQAVTH
jgi:poly-gamma-glutamate synthesis protein (capsule biosynthesis protein)